MDLQELDQLLTDLVDQFGAIDPNESCSRGDFIRLIEDANEDNVNQYIGLLREADLIREVNYEGDGRHTPNGRRYYLDTRALKLYFRRKEMKRQTRLTGSIALFALAQFLLVFPAYFEITQIPGAAYNVAAVVSYSFAAFYFISAAFPTLWDRIPRRLRAKYRQFSSRIPFY